MKTAFREERRQLQNERYRLLVQAVEGIADYAIFMLDPAGSVLTWNLGAQRIKGYREDEIVGKHFSTFYTSEDLARNHPAEVLETASREGKFAEEGWRVRKDGSRFWASILITCLSAKDGRLLGFSKVTRDLTERKRAEEELRRLNEDLDRRVLERTAELEQAKNELEHSLKARDEFLSLASHELKTPITSLQLQTQFIRLKQQAQGKPLDPDYQASLAIIDSQASKLAHVIEDMLDVARVQAGRLDYNFRRVNLSAQVEENLGDWRGPLEAAGCALETSIQPGIVAQVDPYRFEQALSNLLSNAAKYAPGQPIGVRLWRDGKGLHLAVSDRGEGVPEEKREQIFERFGRATEDFGISGLGLGLFITRNIVEMHGGDIRVDSEPGKGSTFTISIPETE